MSVTFFAINPDGATTPGLEPVEVNVSNANATRIERDLGVRPAGNDDIPGGEMTIKEFECALLAAVLGGGISAHYGGALGLLVTAARNAGADVIAWG